MSLCRTYSCISLECNTPRKRTSSFSYPSQPTSNPRPTKVPRLTRQMGLRRTETFICLQGPTIISTTTPAPTKKPFTPKAIPYNRSLQYYKDQRQRQKAQIHRSIEPITVHIIPEPRSQCPAVRPTFRHTHPQPCTTSSTIPASTPTVGKPIVKPPNFAAASLPRQSSPLAPSRSSLPSRPVFPRSKPEPDLYRKALTSCLKRSPEGQQFLLMSKKLGTSVMNATLELEQIVAAQIQKEKQIHDVVMADATALTKSWVVVPGDDWEMVDGTV